MSPQKTTQRIKNLNQEITSLQIQIDRCTNGHYLVTLLNRMQEKKQERTNLEHQSDLD